MGGTPRSRFSTAAIAPSANSRTLRRNRRLGYLIVAALAVALPGVDPVTTTLEMLPLMVLFEVSIWLSAACERRSFAATPAAVTPSWRFAGRR